MKEEATVTFSSDTGTKNQWAKNVFYKQDGNKRSLQTKEIIWSVTIGFLLITTFMLIQGSPEEDAIKLKTSSLKLPNGEGTTSGIKIKGVGEITTGGAQVKSKSKAERKYSGPQLLVRSTQVKVPPGSSVKAILVFGATDGLVRAKTLEALVSNGETKIDVGTLFLGTGSSLEDRLKITFKQIVFQDGSFQNIQAEAFDEADQLIGLKGSQVGNEAIKLGASIGLNFAGGLSDVLQDSEVQGGVAYKKSSLKNAMLNGAATASLDQSREMMNNLRTRHPSIAVPAGKVIFITFIEGN